jgi:hypothetical protein
MRNSAAVTRDAVVDLFANWSARATFSPFGPVNSTFTTRSRIDCTRGFVLRRENGQSHRRGGFPLCHVAIHAPLAELVVNRANEIADF